MEPYPYPYPLSLTRTPNTPTPTPNPTQVASGKLEWSPSHKSENFWRDHRTLTLTLTLTLAPTSKP